MSERSPSAAKERCPRCGRDKWTNVANPGRVRHRCDHCGLEEGDRLPENAVAADRLPDPRAGKERACKCGKMLVSNVIEVGFPCPFCGDKGGPVSAAMSPAEPPRYYESIITVNPTDDPARRASHIAEGIGYACALLMDEYGWSAWQIQDVLERVTDDVADQEDNRGR